LTEEEHHDNSDAPVLRTSSGRMLRGVIIVSVVIAIGVAYMSVFFNAMYANPPPVIRLQAANPPPPPPAQAGVTQVTMLQGASVSGSPSYNPDSPQVPLGNKLMFNNADNVPHTGTSGAGPDDKASGKAFDSGIVNAGEKSKELEITGAKAGDKIPFYCQIHPYMKGQMSITAAAAGGAGGAAGGSAGGSSANTITIPSGASVQGSTPFNPEDLKVKKGDVVTVSNTDTTPHTVTSGTGPDDSNSGKAFDTSIINAGSKAEIKTASVDAGDHPFYCQVHPYMKGKLTVS
jgi:plastocyanin